MDFPIKSINDLERISEEAKWQYFEKLVEFIFSENGYETEQNKVIVFGDTKRQYDIIAKKYGKMFIIECKKWKKTNKNKLIKETEKHEERTDMLDKNAIPLLVTFNDSGLEKHNNTTIIPLINLNWFLNEFG